MKAKPKPAVRTGALYMNGDMAAAEGGLAAGCRFFAGYPITPATEVAEHMAHRLPEVGGVFVQMEDELASMNAILGGSWAGVKSMTSTSGPGISLMMENYGLGMMLETPCVLVNVQRGGPSTGLPTLVGQQDMMQARYGSHGDYESIALAPDSPQECFDLTIAAFNLSEKYRLPVFVMADESIGHMTERLDIPPAEEIYLEPRRLTTKKPGEGYWPYVPDDDLVPPMAVAGEGYRFHVSGLTHDYRGYPVLTAEVQHELLYRLRDKIRNNIDDISLTEEVEIDDAEVVVISYGISSRVCRDAVRRARREGIKAGLFRLKTCWPFPEKRVEELARQAKALIMVEVNLGQMFREMERWVHGNCLARLIPHAGGGVRTPMEVFEGIRDAIREVEGVTA